MINIIGFFAGEFGLGIAARRIAQLVGRLGPPPVCSLMPAEHGRDRATPPYPTGAPGEFKFAYPASLLIAGAVAGDAVEQMAGIARKHTRLGILAYWELDQLNDDCRRLLDTADILFAGSPFTRDVYRQAYPGKACFEIPCPIEIPASVPRVARTSLGLPQDVPLALAAFEPASDVTRKNPDGAIRAFLRSAHLHAGKLVLKVNWPKEVPPDNDLPVFRKARRLIDIARRNPRIIVLDSSLSLEDVAALYASVDLVVSLHRAEGLGLVMLEAMSLGTPVVATAYSGNLGFMEPEHEGLVNYRLVTTTSVDSFYDASRFRQPPRWADPDLDHAAQLIGRTLVDRDFAARLRQQGLDMARRYAARAESASWLPTLMAPPKK